jgi:hypothetical protein
MTHAQLTQWLDAYGDAWERLDADKAASLFSENVKYYETPFELSAEGTEGVRRYWSAETGRHRDVKLHYEIVSVMDQRAVVLWQADYTRTTTKAKVRLDGIFLLDFDAGGRCKVLREWWHRKEEQ